MKKLLAVLLILCMAFSVAAMAEEEAAPAIKLGQVVYAAHGTHCFAVITAVVQGDVICLAKIDEFQFMGNREDVAAIGVPNADLESENFNVKDENGAIKSVLGSKRVNSDLYSLNMQRAGSTVQIAANYDAIEAYVVGKTIADLEAEVAPYTDENKAEYADAIAGATLTDSVNYVRGIIEAAKAAHAQYAGTHGGNTGTYTLWNTTGEDIVGIYMTDLDSGWQSVNYCAGSPLHTLGAEDDNNPFIITRTVTEAEVDNHMRIWAETASGLIIEFPGESEHTGLSIETANIEFANPDTITGPTQIRWFAPER